MISFKSLKIGERYLVSVFSDENKQPCRLMHVENDPFTSYYYFTVCDSEDDRSIILPDSDILRYSYIKRIRKPVPRVIKKKRAKKKIKRKAKKRIRRVA